MKFTIALAQTDSVLGDLARNVDKHIAMADRAIQAGAKLVVFPELSLTGYSIKDMHWDVAINTQKDATALERLIEKSKSISLLVGGVEEGPSFALYNAALLLEDGHVRVVHRKIHPPTYGMFEEMRYFSRGTSAQAFEARAGRLGVLICEDLWHLSLPYVLARDGAQCIIALSASPTRLGGASEKLQTAVVNAEHHKTYARLLSTYVVFCNRVGYEDGVNFWGGSEVVGPSGDVVAAARLFDEDLIVAEIDEEEVRRARRFSRHFLDEDPDLVLRELHRIGPQRS